MELDQTLAGFDHEEVFWCWDRLRIYFRHTSAGSLKTSRALWISSGWISVKPHRGHLQPRILYSWFWKTIVGSVDRSQNMHFGFVLIHLRAFVGLYLIDLFVSEAWRVTLVPVNSFNKKVLKSNVWGFLSSVMKWGGWLCHRRLLSVVVVKTYVLRWLDAFFSFF